MEIGNEHCLLAWLKGLKHLFDNPTRENIMHLFLVGTENKCLLFNSKNKKEGY